MAKTVASLPITRNKSKMTPRSDSANKSVMYLGHRPNRLFAAKDALYVAKTVAGLPIIHNKSEMTQRSDLANKSHGASYLPSCTEWPTVLILRPLSRLC